jgi:hypothetical protein
MADLEWKNKDGQTMMSISRNGCLMYVGLFVVLILIVLWLGSSSKRATNNSIAPAPATSPPNRQQIKYNECVRQRRAAGLDTSPCAEWSRE